MTIRRRQTIGGPKTIDAINSSGACDARNVPLRWCIGCSSCLNRSSAPEKCQLKLRGHNGGESKRVNTDTILGRKGRSEGNEWRGATQLGEDRTTRGYGLICGVSFSRLLSNCALAPVASAWHDFSYTGCPAELRIKLRNSMFYDELVTDFPRLSNKFLIWIALIETSPIGVRAKKRSFFFLSIAISRDLNFNAFKYFLQYKFVYKCSFIVWCVTAI